MPGRLGSSGPGRVLLLLRWLRRAMGRWRRGGCGGWSAGSAVSARCSRCVMSSPPGSSNSFKIITWSGVPGPGGIRRPAETLLNTRPVFSCQDIYFGGYLSISFCNRVKGRPRMRLFDLVPDVFALVVPGGINRSRPGISPYRPVIVYRPSRPGTMVSSRALTWANAVLLYASIIPWRSRPSFALYPPPYFHHAP